MGTTTMDRALPRSAFNLGPGGGALTLVVVGGVVLGGVFIFGVGMQLGGGCASGTLFSAGGGSVRMLATLAAFIAGSVIGALHAPFWQATPAIEPISMIASMGLVPSLGVSLVLFGAVALISWVIERRRHGTLSERPPARNV